MTLIESSVNDILPGDFAHQVSLRRRWVEVLTAFSTSPHADPKFLNELGCRDPQKFWACLSEALVYERLNGKRFADRKAGKGPDFLLEDGLRRTWVELTCPEPTGVPAEWLEPLPGRGHSFPHREILLRWTAAIKAKVDRLLGQDGNGGYLSEGIVQPDEAYVIAVNGCRMRSGPFSQLEGISQYPLAAEAVFPIGPYQVRLNRESLEVVDRGHQYRPCITKPTGALIPAVAFLEPQYAHVSAIWAVDFDGSRVVGNREPAVVVHNPLAVNPIPIGFLPADAEYVATPEGDEYILERHGRA